MTRDTPWDQTGARYSCFGKLASLLVGGQLWAPDTEQKRWGAKAPGNTSGAPPLCNSSQRPRDTALPVPRSARSQQLGPPNCQRLRGSRAPFPRRFFHGRDFTLHEKHTHSSKIPSILHTEMYISVFQVPQQRAWHSSPQTSGLLGQVKNYV